MLRAQLSLEKMTYLPDTGMVMYRSHMHKGLKRNFQLMPGAQWLELLCRHIPDRFEHLVRYVGWYSTRVRGERARKTVPQAAVQAPEDGQVVAARARSAWARLIHKVYEVDPLECPKCGAPMRVIALIEDATVIRRILEHLGRWAPREMRQNQRAPPRHGKGSEEPKPPVLELTYHPRSRENSIFERSVEASTPQNALESTIAARGDILVALRTPLVEYSHSLIPFPTSPELPNVDNVLDLPGRG